MKVLHARNVNGVFTRVLRLLRSNAGNKRESRVGDTVEIPEPVTSVYLQPRERVLFCPERDANPFFHLMEALWMLNGQNDVRTISHYVRRMATFSDDGRTLHGAYGHRWRNHFDFDQIQGVIELLNTSPKSRRAIINMYDPYVDAQDPDEKLKDVPCNVTLHVQIREIEGLGYLDMEVFCRSNDAIWGATGANAVHFSVLQEYIAAMTGTFMGRLYQISCNLHAYRNVYDPLISSGILNKPTNDPYFNGPMIPDRIVTFQDEFEEELAVFMSGEGVAGESDEEDWANVFFPEVAVPMREAYNLFRAYEDEDKVIKYGEMLDVLRSGRQSSDWIQAAQQWTRRRQDKAFEKMESREDPL